MKPIELRHQPRRRPTGETAWHVRVTAPGDRVGHFSDACLHACLTAIQDTAEVHGERLKFELRCLPIWR